MVKDEWKPPGMIDQYLTIILKLRFSLHMVKDDWPPRYGERWLTPPGMIDQYLT